MLFSARGRVLMKMEKIELPTETKKMAKKNRRAEGWGCD
jgi:hypothetical protein